jgi:hypothetical protein
MKRVVVSIHTKILEITCTVNVFKTDEEYDKYIQLLYDAQIGNVSQLKVHDEYREYLIPKKILKRSIITIYNLP